MAKAIPPSPETPLPPISEIPFVGPSRIEGNVFGVGKGAGAIEIQAPLNLRQKMALVIADIGYIEKRGKNESQGYAYAMAADFAAVCGKAMAKHGVAFQADEGSIEWADPRQSRGGASLYVCRVKMVYTFLDTESDERLTVCSTGEGMDAGDKAIYKAKTGALKYALGQTFLIPTGDDPEADRDETADEEKVAQASGADLKKAECPMCHKVGTIIVGNPQYGGGWVCWKKATPVPGCGAKFDQDPRTMGKGAVSEDGKGRKRRPAERISEEQVVELEDLCEQTETERASVIQHFAAHDSSVETFRDFDPKMYAEAKAIFEKKLNRMGLTVE